MKNIPIYENTAIGHENSFGTEFITDKNGNPVATKAFGGSYDVQAITDYCRKYRCRYIVNYGQLNQQHGEQMAYATDESNFLRGESWHGWEARPAYYFFFKII